MNFLRNCGRCWSSSEVSEPEIETEIESPVYDPVYDPSNDKKQVEERISNPSTRTITNPTGTMEIINPCYVKSAADIQS